MSKWFGEGLSQLSKAAGMYEIPNVSDVFSKYRSSIVPLFDIHDRLCSSTPTAQSFVLDSKLTDSAT